MGKGFWFQLKRTYTEVLRPPPSDLSPEEYPDLTGTIALVTGASAGLGLDLTKILASKNCHVLMGVRNQAKAEAAKEKILKELGTNGGNPIGKLDLISMDLSDSETLKTVPSQISAIVPRLDIIVHNAGVNSPEVPPTKEGFDGIIGTNVIGTYFLQTQLDELFLIPSESPYKRLVWLSSAAHHLGPPNGGLEWDKIMGKKKFDGPQDAYNQSKTADLYLAYYWSVVHKEDLLKNDKIVSLHVHPGLLMTEIARDAPAALVWLVSFVAYPLIKGAHVELYAAISPKLNSKEHQGAYICPWGVVGEMRDDVKEGYTNGVAEKLWNYLEDITSKY